MCYNKLIHYTPGSIIIITISNFIISLNQELINVGSTVQFTTGPNEVRF